MKTYLFANRSHTMMIEASSAATARALLAFELGAERASWYQLVSVIEP